MCPTIRVSLAMPLHTHTQTQMLIFHGFIKIFRCNLWKLFQVIMKAYNDSVILWECLDRFTTFLFYYNLSSSDSSHTTSVYSIITMTLSVWFHNTCKVNETWFAVSHSELWKEWCGWLLCSIFIHVIKYLKHTK